MQSLVRLIERPGLPLLYRPLSQLAGVAADGAASSSPAAAASASTSQQAEAAAWNGWIHRGIKEHPRNANKKQSWWEWWWTRKGPDGTPQAVPGWEKMYWGLGLGGISLLVLPRLYVYMKTSKSKEEKRREEEEALRKKQELEVQRAAMIPMMATGKSFVGDEEARLFDGMTPREINKLAQSKLGGVGMSDDPFEGLTPEEIDALYGGQA